MLEPRTLLSLAPVGGEVHVNTYTADSQSIVAAAADADGDYVIVWQSAQEGLNNAGVYAQRFNSSGIPQGGEIHVNINTAGAQNVPAVAMDPDGDFVVAWTDNTAEGNNNFGTFARRFDSMGNPLTGEIHVNSLTAGTQAAVSIATDAAGNFVVAFESTELAVPDVYARRFDFNGVAQGPEFLVNTTTAGYQRAAAVAMDAGGDFVVTWNSYLDDSNSYDIYARRYNSAGVPQSGEIQVNTAAAGMQTHPSIAMDRAGDYVIAWEEIGWDQVNNVGTSYAIYAQRYNAAGVAQGGNFPIVTAAVTTDPVFDPSIGMSGSGGFLVSWKHRNIDGSSWGVYARQFAPDASPIGAIFRVNTTTLNGQQLQSVASDANGNAIIAWQSPDQVGDPGNGIYAQRYQESSPDTVAPIVAGAFVGGSRIRANSSHAGPLQQLVVTFSENVADAGGPSGINSITNPANWLVSRNGVDVASNISAITYGFRASTNRYEATVNFTAPYTSGNFLLKLKDNVRDIAGNRLDGNFDGAALGNFIVPFSVAPIVRGSEFPVNVYTPQNQSGSSIGVDANGNFVIAWTDSSNGPGSGQDGNGAGVYLRRFDAGGNPLSGEIMVPSAGTFDEYNPVIGMAPDGRFVVIWEAWNRDGSQQGIMGQRFSATGAKVGSEFVVNGTTTNSQRRPSVAMDATGDFVVAWTDNTIEGASNYGIYARRFNASGSPLAAQFHVNSYTTLGQGAPAVAMDANGDFVIAWESNGQDGSSTGIYAQRYDAAGAPQGSEFPVNTFTPNAQGLPAVAMDAQGDFMITWQSYAQDGSGMGIFAQRYNAAGVPQGGEFQVNRVTAGAQTDPSVAMGGNGTSIIVWVSAGQDGDAGGIYAQRYDSAGSPIGQEFLVNTYTSGDQLFPAVAMNATGDTIASWTSNGQDGSFWGVYAQRYKVAEPPAVTLLLDNPDPVTAGNSFTLTASGILNVPAASVQFYRESNGDPGLQVGAQGDTLVGSSTFNDGGFWSASIQTTGLAAGTYTYYAQASDGSGVTGAPGTTTNTVNPGISAPAVTAASFVYETAPQRLTFTFNQDVHNSLSTASIKVERLTPNPTVITVSNPIWDASSNTATFNFSGILPDGDYRARLFANGVNNGTTNMAADYVMNFWFLNGDLNRDRTVSISDFIDLAAKFNTPVSLWSNGDLNYDGTVTISDFIDLAANFNKTLGTPPPQVAPQAAASAVELNSKSRKKVKPHHRRSATPSVAVSPQDGRAISWRR